MSAAPAIKNGPAKQVAVSPSPKAVIQPKLMVNEPGDRYEQEADAMAERVMRMPQEQAAPVQATGLIGRSVQRKAENCEPSNEMIFQKSESKGGFEVPGNVSQLLLGGMDSGCHLPDGTKNFMENAFKSDFSNVHIHTGGQAASISKQIGARAFTYGSDIFFNDGQFRPDSNEGRSLIAHELAHTMQEGGSPIKRLSLSDFAVFSPFDAEGYIKRKTEEARKAKLDAMTPESLYLGGVFFLIKMIGYEKSDPNDENTLKAREKYIDEEVAKIDYWLEHNFDLTQEQKNELNETRAGLIRVQLTPLSLNPLYDPLVHSEGALSAEMARIEIFMNAIVPSPEVKERLRTVYENSQRLLSLAKMNLLSLGIDTSQGRKSFYLVNYDISARDIAFFAFGNEYSTDAIVDIHGNSTFDSLIPGQVIQIIPPQGVNLSVIFQVSIGKPAIITNGEIYTQNSSEIGEEIILGEKRYAIPGYIRQVFLTNYFTRLRSLLLIRAEGIQTSIKYYSDFKEDTNFVVRGISDTLGGADFDGGNADDYALQAAKYFMKMSLVDAANVTPEIINKYIEIYDLVFKWDTEIEKALIGYFSDTTKGAERAVTTLKIVKNASFAIVTSYFGGAAFMTLRTAGMGIFGAGALTTLGGASANAVVQSGANLAGQAITGMPIDWDEVRNEYKEGAISGATNTLGAIFTGGTANYLGKGSNLWGQAWREGVSNTVGGGITSGADAALHGKSASDVIDATYKGGLSSGIGGMFSGGASPLVKNLSAPSKFAIGSLTNATGSVLGVAATGGSREEMYAAAATGLALGGFFTTLDPGGASHPGQETKAKPEGALQADSNINGQIGDTQAFNEPISSDSLDSPYTQDISMQQEGHLQRDTPTEGIAVVKDDAVISKPDFDNATISSDNQTLDATNESTVAPIESDASPNTQPEAKKQISPDIQVAKPLNGAKQLKNGVWIRKRARFGSDKYYYGGGGKVVSKNGKLTYLRKGKRKLTPNPEVVASGVKTNMPVRNLTEFELAMVQEGLIAKSLLGEPLQVKTQASTHEGEINVSGFGEANSGSEATSLVLEIGQKMNHDFQQNSSVDGDIRGQAAASHAEKITAIKNPGKAIAVDRPMCNDCFIFFRKLAKLRNSVQVVTEPSGTWIFRPDGAAVGLMQDTVTIIYGNSSLPFSDDSVSSGPME